MIDLRSDTVTKPTDGMRSAMRDAEVGDDVYGEDPTVNALEARLADRLGKQAAVMVPTGTQGNLVSVLTHCGRGDEYLVGRTYHSYAREGGGTAVLGGVKPEPLEVRDDGTIAPETIRAAIKPADDPHCARTELLALENPTGGRVASVAYLEEVCGLAHEHGLSTHLDGARLFNAAVALGCPAREIVEPFDSVTVALSKGLGAPVGSVICGSEAFVQRARRWRKVVGGAWRQAGVLAAAGDYALDHHVDRLAADHRRARRLAERLDELAGIEVAPETVETNMCFAELTEGDVDELAGHLEARDIAIHPMNPLRLVLHIGIGDEEVDRVVEAFEAYLG